jgi:hypothetical protein
MMQTFSKLTSSYISERTFHGKKPILPSLILVKFKNWQNLGLQVKGECKIDLCLLKNIQAFLGCYITPSCDMVYDGTDGKPDSLETGPGKICQIF